MSDDPDGRLFKDLFGADPKGSAPGWLSISESQKPTTSAPEVAIPGYELLEVLGKGGMGIVYKARQLGLGRFVAIKLVRKSLVEDPEFLSRFSEEVKAAGSIRHENVVGAIQCGSVDGRPFLVMEYVQGETLSDVLKKRGRFGEQEALRIAMQVARGLQAAWERKIIHRDIKPENLMITPEGVVKICDLGLCRAVGSSPHITETGQVNCTPQYASPEQVRGRRNLDTRTDIYSLGITLYQMLVGALPFEAKSPAELFVKHLTENPRPPNERVSEISRQASELVLGMMAKKRRMRLPTPGHVVTTIEGILTATSYPASRTPVLPSPPPPVVPAPTPTPPRAPVSVLGKAGIPELDILHVKSDRLGEVQVLKLSGRLSEVLEKSLQERFDRFEARNQSKVLVDCSELEYMNSRGVSIFIAAVDRLRALGGDVKLASVPRQGMTVLRRLGVLSLIQVLETTDQAARAFELPVSEIFKGGQSATYLGIPSTQNVHSAECSLIGQSEKIQLFASVKEAESHNFTACTACCGAGSIEIVG